MALSLKRSTSATTIKTPRTLAEKIQVLILIEEGTSAKDALAEVFGATATPAMENHPHSILSGYRTSVSKAVEAELPEAIEPLREAGMIVDDQDEVKEEDTTQETVNADYSGQAVYTDKELEDSPDYEDYS